jgi:cob(I)alamin adenosyltransferase
MKIYTKTSDSEMTSLIEGGRVFKNDVKIDAYDTLNEFNSSMDLLFDSLTNINYKPFLRNIQIKTNGFIIIRHPSEKFSALAKIMTQACKLKLDGIVATINTPIPGSLLYAEANQYGSLNQSACSKYK